MGLANISHDSTCHYDSIVVIDDPNYNIKNIFRKSSKC